MEKIKDKPLETLLNTVIFRKCQPKRVIKVRIFQRPPLGYRNILGLAVSSDKQNTIWLSQLLYPAYNNLKKDMTILVCVALHEAAHIICDVTKCGDDHNAGWWKVMSSFGLYPDSPESRAEGTNATLKLRVSGFPKYIINLFLEYGCPYSSLLPKGFEDRQIEFYRVNGELIKDILS